MAKRVIVKGEDEPNMNDVWRVVWKDKDFKIFDKKFKDEDDAKSFYYSIEFPNRTRELQLIHEAKFYSIKWELLS